MARMEALMTLTVGGSAGDSEDWNPAEFVETYLKRSVEVCWGLEMT